MIGGHDGKNQLNSSEVLLLDKPCALPDLPVPIYGPAVVIREGANGNELVRSLYENPSHLLLDGIKITLLLLPATSMFLEPFAADLWWRVEEWHQFKNLLFPEE